MIGLSFILYFIYFFVADFISFFIIYKTVYKVVTSPLFYLTVLLVSGLEIVIDVLYRVLEKENEKPLYLKFRSLIDRDMTHDQKIEGFENLIVKLKSSTNRNKGN